MTDQFPAIAERILVADRVRTMDAGERPALTGERAAVAIAAGRILAVGSPADLEALRGPATEEIDLGAATIVPGLTDSHTHVALGLDMTLGIQLTDVGPLAEIDRRVSEAARAAAPGEWVLGWGLDPNVFAETGFTGVRFDAVTGETPMALTMRDGHSMIVNSAALRAAGVDGPVEFTDESAVGLDADGRPNGYLVEFQATQLVTSAIPAEPFEQRVERLRRVLDGFASTGIASTHVLDFAPGTEELVRTIEETGELPVRLRFSPWVEAGATRDDLETIAALQGRGGRRWSVEGVKLFIDGTIDNGSAWLREPDAYGQGTDSVWSDPADYAAAVAFFAERGIPTATHAIGDRGVEYALEAIGAAIGGSGSGAVAGRGSAAVADAGTVAAVAAVVDAAADAGAVPAAGPRAVHRIEHIETIPDELVARFAELGVVASMQPVHGTHHTRADRTDNWSVRLGEERAAHGWRCRDLREAGVTVALGSDWPITPYDPRAMMADSILRRPVERPGTAPVQPEQALTPRMALEGYTTHAAAAAGLSAVAGSIAPGKRADLTVFAADPLEASAEELARTPIVATVVDGQVILR